MNIVGRLTNKHIWSNKKRTWVTIVGVALCTALICSVTTLVASFRGFLINTTIQEKGDYHVAAYALSYEQQEKLAANAKISETAVVRELGYSDTLKSVNESKPYLHVQQFSRTAMKTLPVSLVEGRLPETEEEIVISRHMMENGGMDVKLGEKLTLNIGTRQFLGENIPVAKAYYEGETLVGTHQKTYTVVGITQRMGSESYEDPGYTAFSILEEASMRPGDVYSVYAKLDHPKDAFDLWPSMLKSAGIGAEQAGYNTMLLGFYGSFSNNAYDTMFASIAAVVIALIMVGSVSVIYNAFAISATERKQQFGILASVGATRKQLRHSVNLEGLIIGAIGIPLGIILSFVGIGVTLKVVNGLLSGMLNTDVPLTLVISPWLTLVAVVIAAVTILLSVRIPARRAAKTSPIEAIRSSHEIKREGRVKKNRLARKLFGFEADLALKQLQRSRKRYRVTIFSLVISLVLFIGFSCFSYYMQKSADMQFQSVDFDFCINASGQDVAESSAWAQQVAQKVGRDDATKSAHAYSSAYGEIQLPKDALTKEGQQELINLYDDGGKTDDMDGNPVDPNALQQPAGVLLYGMEDTAFDAMLQQQKIPSVSSGWKAVAYNQNINTSYVEQKKLEFAPMKPVQEPVSATLQMSGNTEGEEQEVQTVEIPLQIIGATSRGIPAIQAGANYLVLVMPQSQFVQMSQQYGVNGISEVYVYSSDPARTADFLEGEQMEGLIDHNQNYILDVSEQMATMNRILLIVSIFCYGFIALMGLITVTSVLNTITTNMQLRRREFAMLQSIGMTPKGMNKMVCFESLFYGLKAMLYALPIGIGVCYLLYRSLSGVYLFPFSLPWSAILIAIAAVFVLVFVTMWYSTAKMRKQNIVESIRQESV